MITNKKVLALIPARGGSKGIKNKNIINLAGKPLIAYSIKESLKSLYIDSVVVSTNSNKIKKVAEKFGARVPFMRPNKLSGDKSKTIDAVIHAINFLKGIGENYDVLILLQPTQPLRSCEDIDRSLEFFVKNKCKSTVSVCEVESHPILIRVMEKNNQLKRVLKKRSDVRRQDMGKFFSINGAIYINNVKDININTSFNDNELGFIMPRIRSIDIDEKIDLSIAEVFLKNKRK